MSYDLQIWATLDPDIALALPLHERWRQNGDVWVRDGRGWQILVGPSHRIEPDDVPDGARGLLPGVRYMIELSLEPIAAPRSAQGLLLRTAKALAVAAHGAILDPQTDSVTTPTGVQRFIKPAREEVLDVLELSWFSTNDALRTREWFDGFVGLLERELPEALPVRYGAYEPPPYRFRELGRAHLVDFLVAEFNSPRNFHFVVWYPQRPVLTLHLSLGDGPGYAGWTAQRITIDVEAAAFRQPGWATGLERTWRKLAHAVGAFYADARILRNQRPGGARASELQSIERHPVCSWFWAGIPDDGGAAVALGEPYLSLWPGFRSAGERDGALVFLSADDWTQPQNVLKTIGGVPRDLAAQSPAYDAFGPNRNRVYPPIWPFGPTHSEQR